MGLRDFLRDGMLWLRPALCPSRSPTVTPSLPPCANSGQWRHTGSSRAHSPLCTRRWTEEASRDLVAEKTLNTVSCVTGLGLVSLSVPAATFARTSPPLITEHWIPVTLPSLDRASTSDLTACSMPVPTPTPG